MTAFFWPPARITGASFGGKAPRKPRAVAPRAWVLLMHGSHAGRLRRLLEQGPLTRMQLSVLGCVPYKSVGGLVANDIDKGRIFKIARVGRSLQFALTKTKGEVA